MLQLEQNTASREEIRTTSKSSDGLRIVLLSNIRINPEFNGRIQKNMDEETYTIALGIPELADGIHTSNGPDDPIKGDLMADGTFYITNGERRYRALEYLVNTKRYQYPNGKPVSDVRVLLNAPGTTDMDRLRQVITSNEGLKLKPMERAKFYIKLKNAGAMTNEQVATLVNVSRQHVDQYVLATQLPEAIQDLIDDGTASLSKEVAKLRKEKAKDRKIGQVDMESGEIIDPEKEKETERELSGDENELADKPDNSVTFPGSMGGFKEESGEVIGAEGPYFDAQEIAAWKQLLNRIGVLQSKVDNEDEMIVRLRMEYKRPMVK